MKYLCILERKTTTVNWKYIILFGHQIINLDPYECLWSFLLLPFLQLFLASQSQSLFLHLPSDPPWLSSSLGWILHSTINYWLWLPTDWWSSCFLPEPSAFVTRTGPGTGCTAVHFCTAPLGPCSRQSVQRTDVQLNSVHNAVISKPRIITVWNFY